MTRRRKTTTEYPPEAVAQAHRIGEDFEFKGRAFLRRRDGVHPVLSPLPDLREASPAARHLPCTPERPGRAAAERTAPALSAPQRPPRLYSYVVRHDGGFSPNPFHGWCTLACCKPVIRRTAAVGDMIVGLSSKCEGIIYAMIVDEVITFAQYWSDPRFRAKRPSRNGAPTLEVGDNIYEPLPGGRYRQLPSEHSKRDDSQNDAAMQHDVDRGVHVLVSQRFAYFGSSAPSLPQSLEFLRVVRGHRCIFTAAEIKRVRQWFSKQQTGLLGYPALLTQ